LDFEIRQTGSVESNIASVDSDKQADVGEDMDMLSDVEEVELPDSPVSTFVPAPPIPQDDINLDSSR
jgi:hypothetical protein